MPHETICPDGLTFEALENETILDACLRNGVHIEHVCEKSCACTTCHVIIEEGFEKVDFRSRNIKNFEDLEKNSVDLYSTVKSLYLQRRENIINNGSTSVDECKDFK